MRGLMASQKPTEDGNEQLPVDFFELELLSNKPDARLRDRELPEIDVASKPGELPVDFFELEFLSNTPDPRQRDRTLPRIEPQSE